MNRRSLVQMLGALCLVLCLTACAGPKSQQETTSPEVVQTQAVSSEVDNTQAPQETQDPNVVDDGSVPTVGADDTDIPNQDVDFGE